MKILINIDKEAFDINMANMTNDCKSDYYSVGAGCYNATKYIRKENIKGFLKDKLEFERLAIISEKMAYGEVDYSVRNGYTIKNNSACYRTCNGNSYGVIKMDDKYFAFFSGRRSRINDLLSLEGVNTTLTPTQLVTNAPKQMYWYETGGEYLIRLNNPNQVAKYITENVSDIKTFDGIYSLQDAYNYYKSKDNEFDKLLTANKS